MYIYIYIYLHIYIYIVKVVFACIQQLIICSWQLINPLYDRKIRSHGLFNMKRIAVARCQAIFMYICLLLFSVLLFLFCFMYTYI